MEQKVLLKMLFYDFLKEGFDFYFQEFKKKNINNYDKKYIPIIFQLKSLKKILKLIQKIFSILKK